jgi:hypothetical protein
MSSTSSAALVPSVLDSSEPACEPSSSSRTINTAKLSSGGTGQQSLSMEMSQPLPASLAMSYAGDSHAKTSAMLVLALELGENDPVCGRPSRASLANFDPDTSSWRTSQRCLIEGWERFSETWPESGMTRSGRLYRRAPWALHTCDDGCSLWPTPTASMDERGFGIPLHENTGRYKLSTVRRVHALVGEHGWRIHPNFTEALMGLPTDWTEIKQSGIPSSRRSRKKSVKRS